jgi:hypothetical protein
MACLRQVGITEPKRAHDLHAFNVITVQHLDRLLGGELMATRPRLDWARLLRRTLGLDPDATTAAGRGGVKVAQAIMRAACVNGKTARRRASGAALPPPPEAANPLELPDLTLLHLAAGSEPIDAGTDAGSRHPGYAPRLEPCERE